MAHEATVSGLGVSVDDEGGEGAPVVVLRARGQALPIFISTDQAKSISHALDGRPFERPLTHDLFVEMLTEFGGAIDRVRIDDLSGSTFLAKIDAERYAGGERRELTFDAARATPSPWRSESNVRSSSARPSSTRPAARRTPSRPDSGRRQ